MAGMEAAILFEVQRRIGVRQSSSASAGFLEAAAAVCGGLDMLAVLEVLDELNSLAGTDDNVPFRQLVAEFRPS